MLASPWIQRNLPGSENRCFNDLRWRGGREDKKEERKGKEGMKRKREKEQGWEG
jgi:hypothetical protein